MKDIVDNRYGFYLDTRYCTGCKACQIACKDKNNLPVGVLWRRVVEIYGGEWFHHDKLFRNSILTYFISSACMHCEQPICVEVCPTGAMYQRIDGIVLINQDLCVGCRYCEMACPYKAPQYDPFRRVMTKCDFCYDLLDSGKDPACVSACQMRVLHFGHLEELKNVYGDFNDIFPLPDSGFTKPAIVIHPHQDAVPSDFIDVKIGNLEEI